MDYTFQYYDDADQPVTPLSDLLKDDASKEDNITVCAKVVKVSDPKNEDERRKKDRLVMFYKIHNDQTGIDTGKYLKPLGRVSRHVNNQAYEVPFAFTDYYKFSYFPRTIIEWNALPNETVNASSLTAFTNCL